MTNEQRRRLVEYGVGVASRHAEALDARDEATARAMAAVERGDGLDAAAWFAEAAVADRAVEAFGALGEAISTALADDPDPDDRADPDLPIN